MGFWGYYCAGVKYCPKCASAYHGRSQFCRIDGEPLAEYSQDPLLGRQIGRYLIQKIIGRGAMGCVYRAMHTELGSEFAVKVLSGDLGADERTVSRFKREAQAASKIRSAHVASVLDFGTTQAGLCYIVMEYVAGRPLNTIIRNEGALPPVRVARIALGIASGLAEAHKLGFVHRDVKPSNVLVAVQDRREIPKLVDFGIVRDHNLGEATQLTQDGLVLGTPAYMAPEQWMGAAVGPPADLYALGIVIYEMMTGRKPFKVQDMSQLLEEHKNGMPPALPLSAGLEILTPSLMAKRVEDRPQSAQTVIEDLEDILSTLSSPSSFSMVMDANRSGADGTPHPSLRSARSTGNVPSSSFEVASLGAPLQTYHDGSSSRLDSSARGRAWMVISLSAAVIVGVAIAFVVLWRGQDSGQIPSVPVSVVDDQLDHESRLSTELSNLRLSTADIENDPVAAKALDNLRQAVRRNDAAAADAAVQSVLSLVKNPRIWAENLRYRLEGIDGLVAEAAQGPNGGNTRAKIEARYHRLYGLVMQAEASNDRRALALAARDIERFLQQLKRGVPSSSSPR